MDFDSIAEAVYSTHRSTEMSDTTISDEIHTVFENAGLTYLSSGVGRIVCEHPSDESLVVKFARDVPADVDIAVRGESMTDGVVQNKAEVGCLQNVEEWQQEHLASIDSYDEEAFLWVIQERADMSKRVVKQDGWFDLLSAVRSIDGLREDEVRKQNVGFLPSGKMVPVDFGDYRLDE